MRTLKTYDTFKTWFDKLNEMISEGVPGAFSYDLGSSSGLDFYVRTGAIRRDRSVVSIADTTVTLADDATSFVYVSLVSGAESVTSALEGALPASEAVVLYKVTTAAGEVTSVEDYRSWPNLAVSDGDHNSIISKDAVDAHPHYEYKGAVGDIVSPLVDLPLQTPRDEKALYGELEYKLASHSTYIDDGVVKKISYYEGNPTNSDAFSIDHSTASFPSLENYIIYLTDGTNEAYRWVDANTDTKVIWEKPVDFEPTTYVLSKPRYEDGAILIEGQSTNLFSFSEDIDNAAWGKNDSYVRPNVALAPDSTADADMLVETTASTLHYLHRTQAVVTGTSYTLSVFAKAAGRDGIEILFDNGGFGTDVTAQFDLVNGTAAVETAGTNSKAYITALKDGWYRCSLAAEAVADFTPVLQVRLTNAGAATYVGDGESGAYLWGLQFEELPFPSSYIPTDSAFVSRASDATYFDSSGVMQTAGADVARYGYQLIDGVWEPRGMIVEEAATNLLTYSEQACVGDWEVDNLYVERNQVIAPDGSLGADRIVSTATASNLWQRKTFLDSNVRTFSIFAKAGINSSQITLSVQEPFVDYDQCVFDMSAGSFTSENKDNYVIDYRATQYGDGWWRIEASFVPVTNSEMIFVVYPGASGLTGYDCYIWGAQLEESEIATSYIPTPATFVSRASEASYYDVNGVLQYAGIDEARNGYKLVDGQWVPEGLIIEKASTNLLTYSEEIDNSYGWVIERATIEKNSSKAPDGTYTSDKIVEDLTLANTHDIFKDVPVTVDKVYTASIYVKAGERSRVRFGIVGTAFSNVTYSLDLSGTQDTDQSVYVGDGWHCVYLTQTASSTDNGRLLVQIEDDTGLAIYDGDGVSGIYVWGAQLEEGYTPSTYINTRAQFVSRASIGSYFDANGVMQIADSDVARYNHIWDGAAWVSERLLIEDQSTNLIKYSEALDDTRGWTVTQATVTPDVLVAPDGNQTMDEISMTGGILGYAYQSVSVTPDATYTLSWYAEAGTLPSVLYGIYDETNAAWIDGPTAYTPGGAEGRHEVTFTVPATCTQILAYVARNNGTDSGTVYVWGAQLELGSKATSYIPTYIDDFGSRASEATYTDANGNVKTAAIDVERTDHYVWNGSGWTNEGPLWETTPTTNLALYSEDFQTWLTHNCSLPRNKTLSPDGVNFTADKIVEGTASGDNRIELADAATVGKTYVFSVFAKSAGDGRYFGMAGLGLAGANEMPIFDVDTGTVLLPSTTTYFKDAGMEHYGNGWYRCWLKAVANFTGIDLRVCLTNTDHSETSSVYAGDGLSGIYVWGAQLEEQAALTSYIPCSTDFVSRASEATYFDSNGVMQTAGVDVARNSYVYDGAVWQPAGLLVEASRTNSQLHSNNFEAEEWYIYSINNNFIIRPNMAVSPTGDRDADRITLMNYTNQFYILQDIPVTVDVEYTQSFYIKPDEITWFQLIGSSGFESFNSWINFNLEGDGSFGFMGSNVTTADASIQKLDNGWWRISLTLPATATETSGRFALVALNSDVNARNPDTTVGDGVSGFYLWGAQFEEGRGPSSLIHTPTSFTSRSSQASYFDSNNILKLANANVERTTNYIFDEASGTFVDNGPLYEKATTNLIPHSEQFVLWDDNASAARVISGAGVAPDGSYTADKVVETNVSTSSDQAIYKDYVPTVDVRFTISVFAKSVGDNRHLGIAGFGSAGSSEMPVFDLDNGTVDMGATSDIVKAAYIENVGNGWYRCSAVFAPGAGAYAQLCICPSTTDNSASNYNYAGDGSSGFLIWGVQIEEEIESPTSYIPNLTTFSSRSSSATYVDSNGVLQTAGVDVARSNHHVWDGSQWVNSGLLVELDATNLALYSEDFTQTWNPARMSVVADQSTAPDGSLTADKLVCDGTSDPFIGQQYSKGSSVSGDTYTWSVWLWTDSGGATEASIYIFDGDVVEVDWTNITLTNTPQRFTITATFSGAVTSSIVNFRVDGPQDPAVDDYFYAWGAQLESGPLATSYIKTTSSTVTRSADATSSTATTREADVLASSITTRESDVVTSAATTREADILVSDVVTREADVVTSAAATREADVTSSLTVTRAADVVNSSTSSRDNEKLTIPNIHNHPSIEPGGEFSYVVEAETHDAVYSKARIVLTAGYGETGINDHSLMSFTNGTDKLHYYRSGSGSVLKSGNFDSFDRFGVTVDTNNVLKTYVNGVKVNETSPGLSDQTGIDASQIGIGGKSVGGDQLFGHIKNVKIYDKALDEDEMRTA